MFFHYHPILGLQYLTFEDASILVYPVAQIPEDFDVDEFMKRWKTQGIILLNSTPEVEFLEYQYPQITSNLFNSFVGKEKK